MPLGVAQLVLSLIADPGVMSLILALPRTVEIGHCHPPPTDSRRAVVSYK